MHNSDVNLGIHSLNLGTQLLYIERLDLKHVYKVKERKEHKKSKNKIRNMNKMECVIVIY